MGRGWVVPDTVIKADGRAGSKCWQKSQQDPRKRKGPFKAEPGWKRAELLPRHWERAVSMQRKPRDLEMWERGGRPSWGPQF